MGLHTFARSITMHRYSARFVVAVFVTFLTAEFAVAKPAHLKAAADYFGKDFSAKLNDCRLCHLPGGDETDKPHNEFGKRLAEWRKDRRKAGLVNDIPQALDAVGDEDADKDGTSNIVEILAGRFPGETSDAVPPADKSEAVKKLAVLRARRSDYVWAPFEPVKRPSVPQVMDTSWVKNPVDAFLAEQYEKNGLQHRPPAPKAVLLRRLYLDLVGVPPTRDELRAFLNDPSPDAYEKVVDQLMKSPRYGEAQARHWMDVWRYSDWAGYGNEVRDSQPHIWRWRDWIIESLNKDRPYDRMVREMLAADEIAPDDTDALRATGFLVRNWYKFSREIWLDRAVEHTGKAFLGVTINCSRCHDHMYDPIPQVEYYAFRAIFSPHDIRTDRLPGRPDPTKDGLVRVFDANPSAATYLFNRGNDADPDKSKSILPAVPAAIRGVPFEVKPVALSRTAMAPDNRPFVLEETTQAMQADVEKAIAGRSKARVRLALATAMQAGPLSAAVQSLTVTARRDEAQVAEADVRVAELKRDAFTAVLAVEKIDKAKDPTAWNSAAVSAGQRQRELAVADGVKAVALAHLGRWQPVPKGQPDAAKRLTIAQTALAKAEAAAKAPPMPTFTPRVVKTYPAQSTGRRTALADWIAHPQNPLTARTAMNHLWLRRFGTGIVPSVFDFGKNGAAPTHPKLLDWLAAEFTARKWSFKEMHRLLVTSNAFRMDSTPDADALRRDPDNKLLWRMNVRRMTAEAVRDSVLAVSGELDATIGGPEIDHQAGMTTRRRSIYFRHAPEKQMTFLELFDAASPTECYRRTESVVPQQALALANSPLTQAMSRLTARKLHSAGPADDDFIHLTFETILSRAPTDDERSACRVFLADQAALYAKKLTPVGGPGAAVPPSADPKVRARESLTHVLMNHNDFVTIR